jgi:hypothetical protein
LGRFRVAFFFHPRLSIKRSGDAKASPFDGVAAAAGIKFASELLTQIERPRGSPAMDPTRRRGDFRFGRLAATRIEAFALNRRTRSG